MLQFKITRRESITLAVILVVASVWLLIATAC